MIQGQSEAIETTAGDTEFFYNSTKCWQADVYVNFFGGILTF